MSATKIRLTNPDSRLGGVGEGIKGFNQTLNPNDLFGALAFGNDPSDVSNFGTAKGALTDMRFANIDQLQAEMVKIASFADSMDFLGIHLANVGKDLSNIQISGLDQPDANDLRKALNTDLPGQTFANIEALNAEIDKVNTFVNQTVPGLLQPVELTTSSVIDAVTKVQGQYNDAIAQANKYGLDYTSALQTAEEKAIAIVRKNAVEQIHNTAQALDDAAKTAESGQANSIAQTMHLWDQQAVTTLESVDKAWRETYGDITIGTQDYVRAMAKAADDLGKSRRLAEFQAQNASDQAADQIKQVLAQIKARGLVAAGNTNQASLINYDAQAKLEGDQLKKTLVDYYGIAYTTTQDYLDQINQLEAVQGAERVALVQKQVDEINASLSHQTQKANYTASQGNFQAAQTALVNSINKEIAATNSQISAIQTNNQALHATADSLRSFVTGLKTSQGSPLTPVQQLQAAQQAYSVAVAKMNNPSLSPTARAALVGNVTSAGSTLLDKASAYYSPASSTYSAIFDAIETGLSGSADYYDAQTTMSDQQLDILKQQLEIQQGQLAAVQALGQLPDDIASLEEQMMGAFNVMRSNLAELNAVAATQQTLTQAALLVVQQVAYGHGIAIGGGNAANPYPAGYDPVAALFGPNVLPYIPELQAFLAGGGSLSTLLPSTPTESHAAGGFITNGTWGRDSVKSGHSRLAGGEYVVKSMEAARFADILPAINNGTYDKSGNTQLISEVRNLNAKVGQLLTQMQKNNSLTAQGSLAVVQAVAGDQYQKSVMSVRNNLARVRSMSK